MSVSPLHSFQWYEGPKFDYRAAGRNVTVNVAGSSWGIQGVKLARSVTNIMLEFKHFGANRILDFGAGSWLRYVEYACRYLPTKEVHAVEFDEAFHGGAAQLKSKYAASVKFWTPQAFAKERDEKFDLILLVNVLNTMPEQDHQRETFECLADRLNVAGWLLVYQRIWTEGENPDDAIQYGKGWMIPQQPRYDYCTYRAGTGAIWFNQLAKKCGLEPVETRALNRFTSNNTLLKIWDKPLGT